MVKIAIKFEMHKLSFSQSHSTYLHRSGLGNQSLLSLSQGWSWSARPGPVSAFGLFGLNQGWLWICLVWPSVGLESTWFGAGLDSVLSLPGLVLGLFGLAQFDQSLFGVAHNIPKLGSLLSDPPVRDPFPSGLYLFVIEDQNLGTEYLT